jgi:hypothetical protein
MVGVVSPRPERQVEILHVVPGRLRLRVLGEEPGTVLKAVTPHLRKRVGVREIRTNEQIGSLLITFDTNQLSLAQLFESLRDLGIAEIKQPQSKEPLDSEAWKKAGTQLQSFIPLLIGLLTTRQLGIQGWRSIPVYLLTANLVRQIMQNLDWAEGKTEGKTEEKAEGRSMSSNEVKGHKADGNNADVDGQHITKATPYEQNGKPPAVAFNTHSTVVYSLVHAVPGRMRFRVPKVAEDSAYLRRLQSLVKKDDWITQMRCNSIVASVVMTYNPMQVSEAEAGLHGISLIQIAASPDSKEPGSGGTGKLGSTETEAQRDREAEEMATEPDVPPADTSSAEPNSLTNSVPDKEEAENHNSEEAEEISVDQDVQPANTDDSVTDTSEPTEDAQPAIAASTSPWLELKSAALSTILRLMAKTPIVGV